MTRRLLERISYQVGILDVDASPKFLRVALENFADDNRVAFRLLRWLKAEKRLQSLDEVAGPDLLAQGADAITSTNAIHLYYDLDETLASWARLLRPGGLAFICSGDMRDPHGRPDEWIIDETVASVDEITAGMVRAEPAFAAYRQTLEDADLMARHFKLREKVFVPVRPLGFSSRRSGTPGSPCSTLRGHHLRPRRGVVRLLCTSRWRARWVGGSEKVEGTPPSPEAVQQRLFLIGYSLESCSRARTHSRAPGPTSPAAADHRHQSGAA